jgi:NADPH:quinone reductase
LDSCSCGSWRDGLILRQVLKDLGAKSIGTVSTATKAKLVKETGFDHVLETYDPRAVLEKVMELTNSEGVIFVYDEVFFLVDGLM